MFSIDHRSLRIAGALAFCALFSGSAPAAETPSGQSVILQTLQWTPDGMTPTGTIWRTFQTWQTDVVKNEKGELVHVDPLTPRGGRSGGGELQRVAINQPGWSYSGSKAFKTLEVYPAKEVHGSAWPASGWQQPDFDDANWIRSSYPQRELYGLVAERCLRGNFQVSDPAKAGEMALTVRFRGGAVAYLNGKEIGRAFLPAGDLKPETLAEEYPKDAYVTADGTLIEQGVYWHAGDNKKQEEIKPVKIVSGLLKWNGDWRWHFVGDEEVTAKYFSSKDPDVVTRYRSRTRKLEVKVPANLLRKGNNVLAIEIHRAPAWEGMFTSPCYTEGKKGLLAINGGEQFWDRSELEDIKLTAATSAAVTAAVAPPAGLHIWNQPAALDVNPIDYADLGDSLKPIHLRGLRNGTYSGELVVGSSAPIKDLAAQVTDLKSADGKTIPAAAIQIGYPRIVDGFVAGNTKSPEEWALFDVLESSAPRSIAGTTWSMGRKFGPLQPIWFTVRVSKEAAVGTYKGTVTVNADGKPTAVPLEMEIVGDWILPDPQSFTTYVGFLECPDAVAKFYKVEMWSDQHWKLLDQEFAILGQLGTKDLFIPMVAKTHLGNPHSMVRWIKQPDGSYKVDTSIAERYLDLAVKHYGKIPCVCLYTSTRSQYGFQKAVDQPICTEVDPATGALTEFNPPKFGTPESQAFWKPAIDQMRAALKARGIEKSMMFGYLADGVGPDSKGKAEGGMSNHFADFRAISPDTKWMVSTHFAPGQWRAGEIKGGDFLGNLSWMFGLLFDVDWMDQNDGKMTYGWRDRASPYIFLAASRSRSPVMDNDHCQNLSRWRTCAEAVLLSRKDGHTFQGFGSWGADFWANEWQTYDPYGNVAMSETTAVWTVGPGKDGPVQTCRIRMAQEGLQEAEARIFVQNSLLDDKKKAKLGADLAKRVGELCDARTRSLTYLSHFRYNDSETAIPRLHNIPDLAAWEEDSVKLFKLAGEVEKALGK